MKNKSFKINLNTNQTEFPRGKRAELKLYDDAMGKHVALTLHYPVGTPNKNGTIFTHDALQDAFEKVKNKQLPIVDYTQDDRGKVIGISTPSAYYKTCDNDSINYDCVFFDNSSIKNFDMEYMINKFHKEQSGVTVVDDFRIIGMSVVGAKYEQAQST